MLLNLHSSELPVTPRSLGDDFMCVSVWGLDLLKVFKVWVAFNLKYMQYRKKPLSPDTNYCDLMYRLSAVIVIKRI